MATIVIAMSFYLGSTQLLKDPATDPIDPDSDYIPDSDVTLSSEEEMSDWSAEIDASLDNLLEYATDQIPDDLDTPVIRSSSGRSRQCREFEDNIKMFEKALSDRTPDTTKKNNQWALNTYRRWAVLESPKVQVQAEIPKYFPDVPLGRINYVLGRFVMEATDFDGKPYKSKTLYNVVSGLNRVLKAMHEGAGEEVDLFRTPRFKQFLNVLDGVLKDRQSKEDPRVRTVDTFESAHYERLWINSFGDENPDKLIATTVFLTVKVFALRAGDELRRLTLNNFEFTYGIKDQPDIVKIRYVEASSKNKQGGRRGIHRPRKVVDHYEDSRNERGFHYWIMKYLAKCPEGVRDGDHPLFLHSLKNWERRDTPWYSDKRPVGQRHFSTLMKTSFANAGLDVLGDFTLRSIRLVVW